MCENSCKALWGFRAVVLWIGGGKGEGIRHGVSWLGMTCDGRETPWPYTRAEDLGLIYTKPVFLKGQVFFMTCHLEWGQCDLLHPTSPVP